VGAADTVGVSLRFAPRGGRFCNHDGPSRILLGELNFRESDEVVEITRAPAALANCDNCVKLDIKGEEGEEVRTCKANILTPPVPCVKFTGSRLQSSCSQRCGQNPFHAVTAAIRQCIGLLGNPKI